MRIQGSLRRALVLGVALSAWACSETVAVEPLLGEGNQMVQRIQDELGQTEAVRTAAAVLKGFLDGISGEGCAQGYGLLSEGYRQRLVALTGSEEQAVKETCAGRILVNGVLVGRTWREVLMCLHPAYLTESPEEIPLRMSNGRKLFFMVQQDGTYRAFVLVQESTGTKVEPFF